MASSPSPQLPMTIMDVKAHSSANVTNLSLGIFELPVDAVSAETIERGKDEHGYNTILDYENYAAYIEKCTKCKEQIRTWARDRIKLQMVTTAQRVGITQHGGSPVTKWSDLLAAWTATYNKNEPPPKTLITKMYEVLFCSFNKLGYWNDELEESFLKEFGWTYSDPESIDQTQHLGKGKGAKPKSNISKIISTCKAEVVKEVNRHARRSHGITVNGKKTTKETKEARKAGKKERKNGLVVRQHGEIIDLTDVPESKPAAQTVVVKKEPSSAGISLPNIGGMGGTTNGMGMGMATMDPQTGNLNIPIAQFVALLTGKPISQLAQVTMPTKEQEE